MATGSLTVLVEAGGHGELQPIADAYQKQTGTKITFVELPYNGLYNRVNSELSSGGVSFDVAALDAIWLPAFAGGLTASEQHVHAECHRRPVPRNARRGQGQGTVRRACRRS